jgi:hypothetical protein
MLSCHDGILSDAILRNLEPSVVVIVAAFHPAGALVLAHRPARCDEEFHLLDLVTTKDGRVERRYMEFTVFTWVGVAFSSWVIVKQTYSGTIDAALLTVYLGFLGGVPVGMSAISSRASAPRSRNDDDLPPAPPPRNMGD